MSYWKSTRLLKTNLYFPLYVEVQPIARLNWIKLSAPTMMSQVSAYLTVPILGIMM